MKKGQVSIRNGIEDFLFPMEYLGISQGNNGGYSHTNQNALDLVGKDAGQDYFYAPATSRVKAIDTKNHAVAWETVKQVRFPNGYVGIASYLTMHDNDFVGIYVGAVYDQGHQIQVEGTGGNATGNHIHFEVASCPFTKMWEQNPQSNYLRFPNGISADQCLFIDDTELRNGGQPINSGNTMKWKYLKDVSIATPPSKPTTGGGSVMADLPSDFVKQNATFNCKVAAINIRKAPSVNGADTGLDYVSGQSVNYEGYVKRDGYVWITWISASTGERRWMTVREIASNEAFGTFS